MKKVFFLSLLSFIFLENGLSTQVLHPDESFHNLRFRGDTRQFSEESFPFIIEEPVPQDNSSSSHFTEEEVDEDAVFSCLGEVWGAFKEKNFDGYFTKLMHLKENNNPEACYLLGMVYEEGLGRISGFSMQACCYYSLALASVEESNPLYAMALRGLERCMEEAHKRADVYYRP